MCVQCVDLLPSLLIVELKPQAVVLFATYCVSCSAFCEVFNPFPGLWHDRIGYTHEATVLAGSDTLTFIRVVSLCNSLRPHSFGIDLLDPSLIRFDNQTLIVSILQRCLSQVEAGFLKTLGLELQQERSAVQSLQ